MVLTKILLKQFRNFSDASFSFHPNLTIVIGENARGKTNLLEGIYTILNGSGFRESREDELITIHAQNTLITALFTQQSDEYSFQIAMNKVESSVQKAYFINKTKISANDYSKEGTKSILFSPEQLLMIVGSPSERRDYFDRLLSSYDIEYKKRIVNYENGLRKRNKILEHFSDERKLSTELDFWNKYLVEQATYITRAREEYVEYINQHPNIDSKSFRMEYIKNICNAERFEESFVLEKRYRKTQIGPQKDDFQIYKVASHEEQQVQHYGSRSEQRLALFWLHFNEIQYYQDRYKKKPILLLDDIFSELDTVNKAMVIHLVTQYQTILTTTENEILRLAPVSHSIITLR